MKVLTLTQPWASLVVLGVKRVETRSWRTSYRGELVIHSAKGWSREDRDFAGELVRRGILPAPAADYTGRPPHREFPELPMGALVGEVRLVDVVRTETLRVDAAEEELGDYGPGRFAWLLTEAGAYPPPLVAVRGKLGLWEWP